MSRDIKDFKGVIPAVISVFHKDEELDEQGTREFIRYLMSMDIGGLYVTGSTGETWMMANAWQADEPKNDGGEISLVLMAKQSKRIA